MIWLLLVETVKCTCSVYLMQEMDKDWSPYASGGRTTPRSETTATTNQCCNVRKCTFLLLNSGAANGGAIAFVAGEGSEAHIRDCYFTECSTGNAAYGGAIYIDVTRFLCSWTCCSASYAPTGTFVYSARALCMLDFTDTTVWKCSTTDHGLTNGGGVIYINTGPWELRNSNFSECVQVNYPAVVMCGVYDGTSLAPAMSKFITCTRCSSAEGFRILYNYGHGFVWSVFISNTSPTGWFSIQATTLHLSVRYRTAFLPGIVGFFLLVLLLVREL
jgi:hypothetical protein